MANDNAFMRLQLMGFSQDEISLSAQKLDALLAEVTAGAEQAVLSDEVKAKLVEISMKFVEKSARFGAKLAKNRNSKSVEVGDLQLYVEDTLGIHVPGFGFNEYYASTATTKTAAQQRSELKRKVVHVSLKEDKYIQSKK